MEEKIKDKANSSQGSQDGSVSFLKVDALRKGSHALALMLRTDDIIVGLEKAPFRGTQKILNEKLKENSETVLTISRKNVLFNVLAKGPLGIKLIETNTDEDAVILDKVKVSKGYF